MRGIDRVFERTTDVFEMLSLDANYVKLKKEERRQRLRDVTSLRSGLSAAGVNAAMSVASLSDFAVQPLEGARRAGAYGFFAGMGKGVVGSVVKPFVELGYGGRALTHGVLAAAQGGVSSDPSVRIRRRPPRVMYTAGGIREYDEAAALLILELANAPMVPGSSIRNRVVMEKANGVITNHIVVNTSGASPYIRQVLLLLTPTHLLLVRLGPEGISVCWTVSIAAFHGAKASSSGVVVLATQSVVRRHTVPAKPKASLGVYQIRCESAKTIQAIIRLLRPLRPLGLG